MNLIRHWALGLMSLCLLGSLSCRCSDPTPPTDEQRLTQRLDCSQVHFYLAIKSALADAGTDPSVQASRKRLAELVQTWDQVKTGETEEDSASEISLTEVLQLGRAVWKLKKVGARLARGEMGQDLPPVLPGLLGEGGAAAVSAWYDAPTEHALLFTVMSVLKAHPKAPLPITDEILLYEAMQCEPAKTKFPSLAVALHGLKAWQYGMNDFCDLAAKEAAAAQQTLVDPVAVRGELTRLIPAAERIQDADLQAMASGFRAAGHGGVALCHLSRGDDGAARPSIKRFIDETKKTGLVDAELDFLQAFYDCGDKSSVEAGKALLTQLEQRDPKPDGLALLAQYCSATDESRSGLARKLNLTARMLKLSLKKSSESELAQSDHELIKTAAGFAGVCEKLAGTVDTIGGAADSAKSAVKGLFKKITE